MISTRAQLFIILIACAINTISATPFAEKDPAFDLISTGIGSGTENRCALRDKYGFIWLGTKNGLQCFDGNGEPVYIPSPDSPNETSNISVSSLYECDNNIWIGANNGLYIFNRTNNSISRFAIKTKYGVKISALVEKIMDIDNDNIWLSTQGQGFFIFNKTNNTLTQNSRHGSFYTDITLAANGLIYLASINGQIQAFRPDGSFVREAKLPNHTSDKNSISIESSGRDVWVASGNNLYQLDTSTTTINHIITINAGAGINTLLATAEGNLLLGTNSGLWSYNNLLSKPLTRIIPDKSTSSTIDVRITALNSDINSDLIIVHPTGPIDILTHKSEVFKFVPLPSNTAQVGHNFVRSIALNGSQTGLWIGSDNGLYFYNLTSEQFESHRVHAIGNQPVTALAAHNQKLWIGTQTNGVALYNTATNHTQWFAYNENSPYTILSNDINSIFCTSKGRTFVLTDWGVCLYDSISGKFPQITDFDQYARGVTMTEDLNGNLFIATANNGIYHNVPPSRYFHNTDFDGYKIEASLMHVDRQGQLWIASQNKGLLRLNASTKEFEIFENPLLNHKNILFFADGIDNAIWIGGNDILLKIDANNDVIPFNLRRHDNWTAVSNGTTSLNDGRTIIGCRNGFLIFTPNELQPTNKPILAFLQSLSFPFLEDDSEELSRLELNTLLYLKKSIKLPYHNNTFTLHFSSSHPMSMPNLRYDYILENVDKTWNTGVSTPEVTYNNLSPGNYRFLLRPHGVLNAEVSALNIEILPPWYLSQFSIVAYILLCIIALISFNAIIRKQLKRKYKRQLHDMRVLKEREMYESKTRYFVDLVHEIRTPLMLISLPLEQITEEEKSAPAAQRSPKRQKYLASMQHNIDYLLGITNQLLDFRRAENSSEIQLSLSVCNVSAMLTNICKRFEEPLKISNKTLNLTLPNDVDTLATIDGNKTERLLMNIIGNAMKYSRAHISVALNIQSDNTICINIADDGPGVPPKERERIFDAYYQISNDNVASSLGTGLGLAYAKLIAVAHKGNITVSSNPGGGALFSITLPLNNDTAINQPTEIINTTEIAIESNDSPTSPNTTILVVEDNNDLRNMITDALGRHYTVITAIDGVMALNILADNNIDVIVSDVMMPRMNGLELCRKVKSDINLSHLPFIILTAKTGHDAQNEGLKCGADVYLEKPFPIKQLANQIANLLRTRQLFYNHMRNNVGNTTNNNNIPSMLPETSGLNKMNAEFLSKMNSIIAQSFDNEEFSIDILAEHLNLSRSSFYRKITSITGMTPSEYLKTFRLNHAAQLLRDGCRVSEVADRVGFTSSSYFAKCFKDKFGVLPSDFA